MTDRGKIYKKRIAEFTDDFSRLKKQLAVLSVFRLVTFLLAVVSAFYFLSMKLYPGITATVLLLVSFFVLIKRYNILARKKTIASNLIKINTDEVDTLSNKFSQFGSGSEFIDADHPYTNDLDIFGNGSLFQYLNRTTTINGKQRLAACLMSPYTDSETIISNQEAIKELIPRIDQRQDFLAIGMLNTGQARDLDELWSWLSEENRYLHKPVYRFMSWFFPVISIITVSASVFNPAFLQYAVVNFLIQLFITAVNLRYNNRAHSKIGSKVEILRNYDQLLQIIEREEYETALLSGLAGKLKQNGYSARKAVSNLAKLVSSFDSRLNIIAGTVLNGFLLWDIQCMLRLEKWKTLHKKSVHKWMDLIGEFDHLCSLATFGFNNPGHVFPKPDEEVIIDFKSVGHPLIHFSERVANDLKINSFGEFYIITGANMAGKSTFLRTVAVNLLLAMTGAPVCAYEACFKPLKIFSSMRTSDSLAKNESYFYAELKRLKELIDRLRGGEKLFIVLDEILKGTNSADKQKGSRAVLGQIVKLNGTGLIATHDLDLADMEQDLPQNLKNKCFEIEINGSEIFFDYKLYNGITKKMNASLLMQQMGILTNK
ncbi:MAG: hypothetical protein JXB00_17070 [Bacteroidales bacterium]|nr:hypothetical protein [Bacteroidales bacterium]